MNEEQVKQLIAEALFKEWAQGCLNKKGDYLVYEKDFDTVPDNIACTIHIQLTHGRQVMVCNKSTPIDEHKCCNITDELKKDMGIN